MTKSSIGGDDGIRFGDSKDRTKMKMVNKEILDKPYLVSITINFVFGLLGEGPDFYSLAPRRT